MISSNDVDELVAADDLLTAATQLAVRKGLGIRQTLELLEDELPRGQFARTKLVQALMRLDMMIEPTPAGCHCLRDELTKHALACGRTLLDVATAIRREYASAELDEIIAGLGPRRRGA